MAQYEAERAEAIEVAHKAMISSYIGGPPKLRGDAERMVAALIKAGWTPPAEPAIEHAVQMSGGGMNVRADYPELEEVAPLAEWIGHRYSVDRTKVYRRRIVVVVDDWAEVPKEERGGRG
ncbi:MAG: hypothetical protein JWQ81_8497 [Amycolatopsis sp.]|nr:hypothetical protein [Amycolatopsis sp.]